MLLLKLKISWKFLLYENQIWISLIYFPAPELTVTPRALLALPTALTHCLFKEELPCKGNLVSFDFMLRLLPFLLGICLENQQKQWIFSPGNVCVNIRNLHRKLIHVLELSTFHYNLYHIYIIGFNCVGSCISSKMFIVANLTLLTNLYLS